jgi:hypothetical protein
LLIGDIKESITSGLQWPPGPVSEVIFYQEMQQKGEPANLFALIFAPPVSIALLLAVSGGIRLAFTAGFLAVFLLQMLIRGPVLLVWARLVEQDKPIFTVIFGAIAAVIEIIKKVVIA